MPAFDFQALDVKGRQQKGTLEGDSERQIRQIIRSRGLAPVLVKEVSGSKTSTSVFNKSFGKNISSRYLCTITRQLATMMQGAIPLGEALNVIAQQTDKMRVRSIILAVRAKVLEGFTLAEALGDFPKDFPALYRATIGTGEQTGQLGTVLEKLADYIEASLSARQSVLLALLYPCILSVVSVLIIIFLLGFVIPDVVKVFTNSGQHLPFLTRALIGISNFVQNFGLVIILFIGGGIYFANRLLKNPVRRMSFDAWLLRLPIVGKLLINIVSARFSSTLSILLSSGIPLAEALRILAKGFTNLCLRQAVEEATDKVYEGASLSKALEISGYFRPILLTMIASGEQSGDLDEMLERASVSQQRDLENQIALVIGIFEPMMLLIMGSIVLLLVLAIIMPILNLNKLVS